MRNVPPGIQIMSGKGASPGERIAAVGSAPAVDAAGFILGPLD
jgi:hypothetical protein